jgi:CRP-like cAMP-binding protein
MVAMSDLALELVMPVEDRIWRRLAVLADAYGDELIRMTQDHLAHVAGAARQTVNRVLRQAEADGVIELTRGALRVIDVAETNRRAGRSPTRVA